MMASSYSPHVRIACILDLGQLDRVEEREMGRLYGGSVRPLVLSTKRGGPQATKLLEEIGIVRCCMGHW